MPRPTTGSPFPLQVRTSPPLISTTSISSEPMPTERLCQALPEEQPAMPCSVSSHVRTTTTRDVTCLRFPAAMTVLPALLQAIAGDSSLQLQPVGVSARSLSSRISRELSTTSSSGLHSDASATRKLLTSLISRKCPSTTSIRRDITITVSARAASTANMPLSPLL